MRSIKQSNLETAYQLTCDIVDAARDLADRELLHPACFEIVWEKENDQYDIYLDVSIKPRGKK